MQRVSDSYFNNPTPAQKKNGKKKATDGCWPTSHVTLASHRELKIFSRMGGSYEAVKRLTLPHKCPNLYMAIFVAVCVYVCVSV